MSCRICSRATGTDLAAQTRARGRKEGRKSRTKKKPAKEVVVVDDDEDEEEEKETANLPTSLDQALAMAF